MGKASITSVVIPDGLIRWNALPQRGRCGNSLTFCPLIVTVYPQDLETRIEEFVIILAMGVTLWVGLKDLIRTWQAGRWRGRLDAASNRFHREKAL